MAFSKDIQLFKYVHARLWPELKHDVWFFIPCGVVAGLLSIVHVRLKVWGIAQGEDWAAKDIMLDFLSMNAFLLIWIGLIVLEAIWTLMKKPGMHMPRFEAINAHIESRLFQLTSAMLSFILGLIVVALGHAACNKTTTGVRLTVTLMVIAVQLLGACLCSSMVKFIDKRWSALLMLVFAVGIIVCLLVWGKDMPLP